jgi:hypothetical protein
MNNALIPTSHGVTSLQKKSTLGAVKLNPLIATNRNADANVGAEVTEEYFNKDTPIKEVCDNSMTDEDFEMAIRHEENTKIENDECLTLLENINTECESIRNIMDDISTVASNRMHEGSMRESEALELYRHLEQTKFDCRATLKLFES